jgi:hypothetical protein
MSFRTDGRWIWTDAVAYYVREYGLAPEAKLLSHIRSRRYEPTPVDAVDHHLAMAALQSHVSEDEATRR